MNDRRTFASQPHAPDPGALQRAWLQNTTPTVEPFARCVMIADDVDAGVPDLGLILRMAGAASVHRVNDARKATDCCHEVHPDLVLMDLDMAFDGHEVLCTLRGDLADDGFVPVIALTSDPTPHAGERALGAGASDLVIKPYNDIDLVRRVRNLLTMRALYQMVQRRNLELHSHYDA